MSDVIDEKGIVVEDDDIKQEEDEKQTKAKTKPTKKRKRGAESKQAQKEKVMASTEYKLAVGFVRHQLIAPCLPKVFVCSACLTDIPRHKLKGLCKQYQKQQTEEDQRIVPALYTAHQTAETPALVEGSKFQCPSCRCLQNVTFVLEWVVNNIKESMTMPYFSKRETMRLMREHHTFGSEDNDTNTSFHWLTVLRYIPAIFVNAMIHYGSIHALVHAYRAKYFPNVMYNVMSLVPERALDPMQWSPSQIASFYCQSS